MDRNGNGQLKIVHSGPFRSNQVHLGPVHLVHSGTGSGTFTIVRAEKALPEVGDEGNHEHHGNRRFNRLKAEQLIRNIEQAQHDQCRIAYLQNRC